MLWNVWGYAEGKFAIFYKQILTRKKKYKLSDRFQSENNNWASFLKIKKCNMNVFRFQKFKDQSLKTCCHGVMRMLHI